jgi:LPS sulfotransferase NodH
MSAPAEHVEWDQFGPLYDFPKSAGRPQTYLIASTGRSGSHFLGHLLFATRVLGAPLEYLHPEHYKKWRSLSDKTDFPDVLDYIFSRRTSPSHWFGMKAHWPQFAHIAEDSEALKRLNFNKYLRIVRKDTVAQAVSLVIAGQSKSWISFQPTQNEVRYNFKAIKRACEKIEQQNRSWDRFFADQNIHPRTIFYETLVENPAAEILKIAADFGISPAPEIAASSPRPRRQSTEINQHWIDRFKRDELKESAIE